MSSEMLPADVFTRTMRPWRKTIKIKHLLRNADDSDEGATKAAAGILAVLNAEMLEYVSHEWDALAQGCTLSEFNDELERLYDYADLNRVWIG